MKCPFCRVDNDRVIDSRSSEEGFAIRRRRECSSCSRRYTTFERLGDLEVKVVKKDGIREPFQPEKIRKGLHKALWKRPISDEQVEQMVASIERIVYSDFDAEIGSVELGTIVMKELGVHDQVAYVRFASVYREFKDVNDFAKELKPMLKNL